MKLNKKTFFILGGSLLVLLLLLIIYFLLFKNGSSKIDSKLTEETRLSQERDAQNQKQIYEDYEKQLAALYAKNIDNCQSLAGVKEINKCVNKIAIQAGNKEYCERITEDNKLKGECLNSIDYFAISWGDDPNECNTLIDDVWADNCWEEYFVKLERVEQCSVVKDENRKKQCFDLVNNRLATVFNQPEACDLITDQELKINCQLNKSILPLDSDGDGLSDDIEMSFGTNPFRADTDGDGANDYAEINKYHTNPRSSK